MQKATLFNKQTQVVNEAGGLAFNNSNEVTLARLVCTFFLGATFYTGAKTQLESLQKLASKCSANFVASCAVYSASQGKMKDTPVALLCTLRSRDKALYKKVFNSVITDGRLLRGLVQMIRSGEFGSKSLGSCTRKLINRWLEAKTPMQVWNASIGGNPSLKDVLCLSRPSTYNDPVRSAVYKLIVKNEVTEDLPSEIKAFYAFKENMSLPTPKVPFLRLTSLELKESHWRDIAKDMTWNALRQNLNTLERRNVFKGDPEVISHIVNKLSDKAEVVKAKVFPYQIYTSYTNVAFAEAKHALQKALDYSVESVPVLPRNTVVAVDVSGSMGVPVNGQNVNGGLTCSQVAALTAISIYRKNPSVRVLTFDTKARDYTSKLNSCDSFATNMDKLIFDGGGTSCSAPLNFVLNTLDEKPCDLFILVSDNESWADFGRALYSSWKSLKQKNPNAKMVLIDLVPSRTAQMPEEKDVLFVAGFTDNLFTVIQNWLEDPDRDFVKEILDSVKLD